MKIRLWLLLMLCALAALTMLCTLSSIGSGAVEKRELRETAEHYELYANAHSRGRYSPLPELTISPLQTESVPLKNTALGAPIVSLPSHAL